MEKLELYKKQKTVLDAGAYGLYWSWSSFTEKASELKKERDHLEREGASSAEIVQIDNLIEAAIRAADDMSEKIRLFHQSSDYLKATEKEALEEFNTLAEEKQREVEKLRGEYHSTLSAITSYDLYTLTISK